MQPIIMFGEPVKEQMFKNWIPDSKAVLTIFSNKDDAAGRIYVRNKMKECAAHGIQCKQIDINNLTINQLIQRIEHTAVDVSLFGIDQHNYIIVQKPIPPHLQKDEKNIDELIKAYKRCDIDAFGGDLKTEFTTPATPLGIMKMIDYYVGLKKIDGMNAVVLGRSEIVGKPIADLLLNANCTVTICHSHTKNLKDYTRNADLIVSAIGKPKLITSDYIGDRRPIIVDVGINRDENGKLCGDVDFENVKEKCSFISPVPRGVGVLTVASLIYKMGKCR